MAVKEKLTDDRVVGYRASMTPSRTPAAGRLAPLVAGVLLAVSALAAGVGPVAAQSGIGDALRGRLQAVIDDARHDEPVPGVTAAVVTPDDTWVGVAGKARLRSRRARGPRHAVRRREHHQDVRGGGHPAAPGGGQAVPGQQAVAVGDAGAQREPHHRAPAAVAHQRRPGHLAPSKVLGARRRSTQPCLDLPRGPGDDRFAPVPARQGLRVLQLQLRPARAHHRAGDRPQRGRTRSGAGSSTRWASTTPGSRAPRTGLAPRRWATSGDRGPGSRRATAPGCARRPPSRPSSAPPVRWPRPHGTWRSGRVRSTAGGCCGPRR